MNMKYAIRRKGTLRAKKTSYYDESVMMGKL